MPRRVLTAALYAVILVGLVLGWSHTGHCGENANIYPKIVNWSFAAFRVDLSVFGYPDEWQAYCVLWGDDEHSCRDLPDDVGVFHYYKACSPEIPVTVMFIVEKKGKPKVVHREVLILRVVGCN